MVCSLVTIAQDRYETVHVITDKNCYVTGECVNVSLLVTKVGKGSVSNPEGSDSKVAYVEIADANRMVAQSMVALENGRGWANISLPLTLHSGNYQLTAYTNDMRNRDKKEFTRSLISIVNPTKVSRYDNIEYLPLDSATAAVKSFNCLTERPFASFNCGDTILMNIGMKDCLFSTATVSRADIATPQYVSIPHLRNQRHVFRKFIPELEGHIVTAKKRGNGDIHETRLVMVGKNATLYDGKQLNDSTYVYFTDGLYGNLPTLINAYDKEGQPVAMEVESPYAGVLPASLPKLTVYCSENDLRSRSIAAQKEKIACDKLSLDTLSYSRTFMSAQPKLFYDLDDYTKLHNVREILLEFLRGVHKKKFFGATKLFIMDYQLGKQAEWPALILLDGMPIHNIDDILDYDGHLLKYIQIYPDKYTFGNSVVTGVVQFISKKGRLSNFKLDSGSKLMKYSFPQQRPALPEYESNGYGTQYWNPDVTGNAFSFAAPSVPGRYNVVIQGVSRQGKVVRTIKVIEVK